MSAKSFWIANKSLPRFQKLKEDLKVDVVVVGGGITGVTAAYLLKKAGRKVALLERERCARVDTGHTTAHLTCVTDLRLQTLVKNFGKDHAQATWDAGMAAIQQIQEIISAEKIDCGFTWVPGYLHAPWGGNDPDRKGLQEDARLAQELGFDATFSESVPLAHQPGVRFSNQAKFHPLQYLAGILPKIPGKGSHVFENTEASEFHESPTAVEANGHKITCKHLVFATHVPLMGKTGLVSATLFQSKLAPYSSYAIGAKLPKGSAPEAMWWDTAEPYNFLRVDQYPRHDYAIFGGADHKTGQKADPQACYRQLEKALKAIFPDAHVNHRWTGQVIETNDGLPFIGETAERQFVATGYAGNGMTFGTLGAMMARDSVLGRKNPWQDLFDVSRKKIKGGLWDYLKENIDYPYYYLKDRIVAAEGKSLRSVKREDGKILKLEGERVAVHRDAKGEVTTLSPVCTHMGCIVRWNKADTTWDCPCHGSRFKPTGEVLAGPAEAPLEEMDPKNPE